MSEEEKKAISDLSYIIVTDIYDNEVSIDKTKVINEYNHSVGVVLNLIQKQQKEIEHLKELNKHQSNDITRAVNYTFELNKEIEKKDKIIDEMAETLRYYNGVEQIQEFCIDICEKKKCNIEDCKKKYKTIF